MMTNPHFEPLVRRLGFDDFVPLGTEALFQEAINDPTIRRENGAIPKSPGQMGALG
jgi:hypothetical protein